VTSTADTVATVTVEETSTAATRSAAVATSTAEEVSTVDTVAADPMAAMVAATADAGKFLDSSTPQTAGSTLCRPFSFLFEREARRRNAFVVATQLA
jgi:hypothetical protein